MMTKSLPRSAGGAMAGNEPVMMAGGLLGPAPQPPRPSIWSSFGGALSDPDRRAKLAIALEGMTMNPNQALIGTLQEEMKGRAAQAGKNRTIEWLRSQGRDDLAAAMEAGLGADAAFGMALAPPEQQGRVVSAAQLMEMFPGTKLEDGLYNLKADGTITKVGGGGTTVNLNNGQNKFEEEAGKLTATMFGDMMKAGVDAQAQLSQIDVIDALLAQGAGGTGDALKIWAQDTFGINVGAGGPAEALSAVLNQLVPAQRPPGSGQMSDKDVQLFRSSLPQLVNSPEGNRIISMTMRGIAQFKRAQGEIGSAVIMGSMTREEGLAALQALPDPMAEAVAYINAKGIKPGQSSGSSFNMSREDATKLLLESTR